MDYKNKYLKYKNKYLKLNALLGGSNSKKSLLTESIDNQLKVPQVSQVPNVEKSNKLQKIKIDLPLNILDNTSSESNNSVDSNEKLNNTTPDQKSKYSDPIFIPPTQSPIISNSNHRKIFNFKITKDDEIYRLNKIIGKQQAEINKLNRIIEEQQEILKLHKIHL